VTVKMSSEVLDRREEIERLDPEGMLDRVEDTPGQWRRALARFDPSLLPARAEWSSVLMAGMGGSAIAADLLTHYAFRRGRIPLEVVRDYDLPNGRSASTLAVCVSYSGNTEETLSVYAACGRVGMDRVALTTGGSLAERAGADGVPVLRLPTGFPPRAALASSFVSVGRCLEELGAVHFEPGAWEEVPGALEAVVAREGRAVPSPENPLKRLAERLVGRIPVLYGPRDPLGGVLVRARGQLAENSKVVASHHELPEMNHNEVEGWNAPEEVRAPLHVVFLRDEAEHPNVRVRCDATAAIVQATGTPVDEIRGEGKSLLARLFTLILRVDLVSVYLALLYRCDPTPVRGIEALKARLAEELG
jgi:glucose/mannose-6-phosphate isomerase